MDNINTYKKTNKKWAGLVVYKHFQFGELVGYSYKTRAKQLQSTRGINGIEYKEVNVGWRYQYIPRGYTNEEGIKTFMSLEELASTFE